jgi:hypothetical protein
MGCVISANFVVLVNGEPMKFFRTSRGLRQGYPMSPCMFLLVVEGLRRLIHEAKEEGKIEGIKIARILRITCLLFVDDVVLYGRGTVEEWIVYKGLI